MKSVSLLLFIVIVCGCEDPKQAAVEAPQTAAKTAAQGIVDKANEDLKDLKKDLQGQADRREGAIDDQVGEAQ